MPAKERHYYVVSLFLITFYMLIIHEYIPKRKINYSLGTKKQQKRTKKNIYIELVRIEAYYSKCKKRILDLGRNLLWKRIRK